MADTLDLYELVNARISLPDMEDGATTRREWCELLRLDYEQVLEVASQQFENALDGHAINGTREGIFKAAIADGFLFGLVLGHHLAAVSR